MLTIIMSGEARERLSRIALVKPEKARAIETMILAMAQRRQITSKVGLGGANNGDTVLQIKKMHHQSCIDMQLKI